MREEKLLLCVVVDKNGNSFIGDGDYSKDSYYRKDMNRYLFDGEKPEPTFVDKWVKVKKVPEEISYFESSKRVNYRYRLIDESMESDKIPLELLKEEAGIEKDYDFRWHDKYAHLSSLYNEIYDELPPEKIVVPFEILSMFHVEEVVSPKAMSYKINRTKWDSDGTIDFDVDSVQYKLINRIMYPEIILPQTECFISSSQMYRIVRQYIKDNINPVVAKITSDYDFCFTVMRRIKLSKVKKWTVDVNNSIFQKRKRKPKYVERGTNERLEECFEMTHTGANYRGYTPISAVKADNQAELDEKISEYLKNLIEFINVEPHDCPHCNGDGIVFDVPER